MRFSFLFSRPTSIQRTTSLVFLIDGESWFLKRMIVKKVGMVFFVKILNVQVQEFILTELMCGKSPMTMLLQVNAWLKWVM